LPEADFLVIESGGNQEIFAPVINSAVGVMASSDEPVGNYPAGGRAGIRTTGQKKGRHGQPVWEETPSKGVL
jgi:hypothetical protein